MTFRWESKNLTSPPPLGAMPNHGAVNPNMPAGTHNSEGVNIDLYIPRKCSATNRLIEAKDKASIQINIGHVNADGVYTGEFTTMALCGFIRSMGEADGALDRLWTKCYDDAGSKI